MDIKDEDASLASIHQLAHRVVSEWTEKENISLRPAQKHALKNAIAEAMPAFTAAHGEKVLTKYIKLIRQDERRACINAVSEMSESFPGFVSKQRLLNFYAYPEKNTYPEKNKEPETIN
ncbi:MAG: hypothetical protein KTR32_21445 [Granulosicoccus sp.]|nr:hypothetical protein [Granulosicoccus sp.]